MSSAVQGRMALIAAAFCGIAGAAVAFLYLSQQTPEEAEVQTVEIIVARRDLPPFTSLRAATDLDVLRLPATFGDALDRSITSDHLPDLDGRKINRPVLAGTPILFADLTETTELTISPGHFALSIGVSKTSGVSGLLVPGDRVKLLVTRPLPEQQTAQSGAGRGTPDEMVARALQGMLEQQPDEWETIPVSSDTFRVLAVDQRISAIRQQFDMLLTEGVEPETYGAVTLEVTEDQAMRILSLSGGGQLPVTLLLAPQPATGFPGSSDF